MKKRADHKKKIHDRVSQNGKKDISSLADTNEPALSKLPGYSLMKTSDKTLMASGISLVKDASLMSEKYVF